ncbi:P-loop NTPase [Leucobacter sp. UCMA 4100]|uniref:P-loop NTPase n=1 Tax=Leucobacter sp. UCMA 4100 TaxID=2810534 RepID=UPI002A39E470|nr:P-loop NTPase [Leucobacter sp. UCMA 4100]
MEAMDTALWKALSRVIDPEIRKPITELGMITQATVEGETAVITLLLTIVGCPAARSIERDTREAALSVEGISEVDLTVGVMTPAQRTEFIEKVRGKAAQRAPQFGPDSLTRIIAVTSGKGGVGKSSVTANLAFALERRGYSVGIIDADIFGFSIPALLGLSRDGVTQLPTRIDDLMVPPVGHGVKAISIGMFLGDADPRETAVSWRGPMLHRTLEQFLRDVWFGDLDFLLLDLPPGTGDVALSVGQLLPQSEVLVVTTPQVAAADVAVRSGILAMQSGQRLLGVVETMSGLAQPDGQVLEVFGSGGGSAVAERLTELASQREGSRPEVKLLAKVPLSVPFREAGDSGEPAPLDDPAVVAIAELAERIAPRPGGLAGRSLPLSV